MDDWYRREADLLQVKLVASIVVLLLSICSLVTYSHLLASSITCSFTIIPSWYPLLQSVSLIALYVAYSLIKSPCCRLPICEHSLIFDQPKLRGAQERAVVVHEAVESAVVLGSAEPCLLVFLPQPSHLLWALAIYSCCRLKPYLFFDHELIFPSAFFFSQPSQLLWSLVVNSFTRPSHNCFFENVVLLPCTKSLAWTVNSLNIILWRKLCSFSRLNPLFSFHHTPRASAPLCFFFIFRSCHPLSSDQHNRNDELSQSMQRWRGSEFKFVMKQFPAPWVGLITSFFWKTGNSHQMQISPCVIKLSKFILFSSFFFFWRRAHGAFRIRLKY